MTTLETQTNYVLEGLLRCRECGDDLQVSPRNGSGVSIYWCPSCAEDQPCPPTPAEEFERWILRQVTHTVMTESNTRMLTQEIAAAVAALPADAPETLRNPERHSDRIRALATDPATFFAPDGASDAKTFLSKLIGHITLGNQEAVVHYALPLPQDSALPGAYRQHLPLPYDGVD